MFSRATRTLPHLSPRNSISRICARAYASALTHTATSSTTWPRPLRRTASSLPAATRRAFANMASATTFYDFKPLDSVYSPQTIPPLHPLTHLLRKGRRGPPRRLQGQGRPRRQHGLQVRLHSAVRRTRDPLQERPREARRRLCHPRLPLQPVWRPGPGHRR